MQEDPEAEFDEGLRQLENCGDDLDLSREIAEQLAAVQGSESTVKVAPPKVPTEGYANGCTEEHADEFTEDSTKEYTKDAIKDYAEESIEGCAKVHAKESILAAKNSLVSSKSVAKDNSMDPLAFLSAKELATMETTECAMECRSKIAAADPIPPSALESAAELSTASPAAHRRTGPRPPRGP